MSDDISIRLTAENSDFNAKIDASKEKVKGVGKEVGESLEKGVAKGARAVDEYNKKLDEAQRKAANPVKEPGGSATRSPSAARAIGAFVDQTEKAVQNLGKSSRELKLIELAARGATAEEIQRADAAMRTVEAYKAQQREQRKLDAVARQTAAIAAAQGLSTKSARMVAFQQQQLAFQLNDFFVQVAGGQSPITALIQQGSQLSGTFGGIGGAIRAVLGLLTPARLAFGGLAATIGTLGYVMYQGAEKSKEFADAIVKTGNMAGQTESQFLDLSHRVADASNSTVSSVREIATALISTGQIGSESFSGAVEAAVAYSKITGKTAEDSAADFAKMAQDPKKFAAELNRSFNLLTGPQYDLIASFQEQGRQADAVGVIYEALAQRSTRLGQNLTALDRILRDTKKEFSDMWEAAFDTQRTDTFEGKLARVQKALNEFDTTRNPFALSSIFGKSKEQLLAEQKDLSRAAFRESENATAQSMRADAVQQKVATQSILEGYEKRAKSVDVLNDKLAEAKRLFKVQEDAGTPFSLERQKVILDEVKKEFTPTEKKGPKGRDPRKAQLALDLENIRAAAEEQTHAYDNAEKILEAKRAANLIDERQYYDAKAAFVRLNADTQERALEAEIARLEREKVAGADALEVAKQIAVAKAKLAKVRADAATTGEIVGIQDAAALKRLTDNYVDAAVAAQNYLDTINRQNDREVAGIGKGNKFRDQQAELNRIEDKLVLRRAELDGEKRRGQIDTTQYGIYLGIAEETYRREVAAFVDRTERIDDAQSKHMNGMTEAFRNYADEARKSANLTEQVFGNALQGLEDAFTEFGKTGRLSFKDLINSIQGDLVRAGFRSLIGAGIDKLGLGGKVGGLFSMGKDGAQSAAQMAAQSAQTAAISTQTSALVLQTAATQALTMSAEAAAAALTALANTSAAGGGSGLAGSILSAVVGAGSGTQFVDTSMAGQAPSNYPDFLRGGRAIGGPVSSGGMYRVNEDGPELLTVAGNQYLMTGDQSGKVTPIDSGKSGPSVNQTVNFYNSGPIDRNTQSQLAAAAFRGGQRAMARNM